MTTTIAPPTRPTGRWLPTLSLLIAGGAAALGVVAITTDDVTNQPTQIVVDPPAPIHADVDQPAVIPHSAAPVACGGQARLQQPCYE